MYCECSPKGIANEALQPVMKKLLCRKTGKQWRGALTALFVLGAYSGLTVAAEPVTSTLGEQSFVGLKTPQSIVPFPLSDARESASLPFDLGGSDQRKLRLQLEQPIDLRAIGIHGSSSLNGQRVIAGNAVDFRLDDRLSLGGGMTLGEAEPGFQALGKIHCENGTLNAGSYTATNCYFIDRAAAYRTGTAALGAKFRVTDRATASMRMYESRAELDVTGTPWGAMPTVDPIERVIAGGNPLLPSLEALPGTQALESEMTGIDLEFQVGISTDRAGDMVVGLQLTRILDSAQQGVYYSSPGIHNWTIAEPFDTAGLSLDWSRGAFSGGVQSYYRTPVDFLNRQPLDAQTTFDVHFTWRAPWNASFSVGASNVLDEGVDEGAVDTSLTDPFESIYGRIPYVRYKQDL